METAKELICGLGKLAEQCTSFTRTHSDIIKCGLQLFLGSQILSAILRISTDDATSSDATFSFMSPTFKDFFRAATFYLDRNDGRILETPTEIHNYHYFLAGLSDPMQRKLLETSVGLFNSGRLSEFHRWLMRTAAEVLPGMNKTNHWQVLRLLHHTLSPTLVRESVGSCKWRLISYGGMQEEDCAALAFVVQCLGEMQHLNLYMSSLTEEQAENLMTVFRLAKTINLDQSSVSVIKHLARALKEGRSTDVSLSHCKLGDEAVKILCSSITHSSLHTLNLDHCSLTVSCLTMLSSALTSSLSELRNLVLRRTRLGDDMLQHHSQTLQSDHCKLNTLSMNACELTEPVFSALGSVLVCETSRLKELNVGVNRVGDAEAKHIWKELKHPYCQLQHLDLEMVKLTPVWTSCVMPSWRVAP